MSKHFFLNICVWDFASCSSRFKFSIHKLQSTSYKTGHFSRKLNFPPLRPCMEYFNSEGSLPRPFSTSLSISAWLLTTSFRRKTQSSLKDYFAGLPQVPPVEQALGINSGAGYYQYRPAEQPLPSID